MSQQMYPNQEITQKHTLTMEIFGIALEIEMTGTLLAGVTSRTLHTTNFSTFKHIFDTNGRID